MKRDFHLYRRIGHRLVSGWLAAEVLDMLKILDSAQRSIDADSARGAVAEIGIHHGRLFIGLRLLQAEDQKSVAIDLFGDQQLNTDNSGKGDLSAFKRNLALWSSRDSVVIHQGDSTMLHPSELRDLAGGQIRVFSVDGGHTEEIVLNDMKLAESTIADNGIVVADDVFNQQWPGVSTGTLRFLKGSEKLVPFAIGFNKVFFAAGEYSDLYRKHLELGFSGRFLVSTKISEFAGHEVLILTRVPRRPRQLVARSKTAKRIYRAIRD